ncbi:FAD/NAD(P)-binding protein [Methylorubrum thiocyanatum]|uniref:FAD/NAD(P)-binding protein n=1 Tax=Methylorubrum thiocyanatum TaxID=47958 RepID=UPI003F7EE64F
MRKDIYVAIIGGGPRALTVLERLAAIGHRSSKKLSVHVFDPNPPGQGAHDASQHWSLLTNTLASQVTIFAPTDPHDPMSAHTGPSFTEWARSVGIIRREHTFGYGGNDSDGDLVSDGDYLPRALLGSYLTSAYQTIVSSMPVNIAVTHHSSSVIDIERGPGGHYHLQTADGSVFTVEFCFLTTGHCESINTKHDNDRESFVDKYKKFNPLLRYVSNPYPLTKLDEISNTSVVAVQGLGLTAYDVIASLTLGRGGRYEGDGQTLSYVPSGDEPRITLFSRNCLPYAARGINQKGITGRHVCRFFTRDAVEALRSDGQGEVGRKLDFLNEVLPLLEIEMAYAYRCSSLKQNVPVDSFSPTEEELKIVRSIFEPDFVSDAHDHTSFFGSIRSHLADDLAAAFEGNLQSPLKAATDVIRDARDALAAAVEFGGLTPDSHRFFCEHFVAIMNRVSFGPPRHRNAELIALIAAGIVEWAGGPRNTVQLDHSIAKFLVTTKYAGEVKITEADALIIARLPAYRPSEDRSLLTANLLRRGLIREYRNGDYHPYGLDIDRDQHPITSQGTVLKDVWAIGYPVEGARFYTHALPRPFRRSTQVIDAERAVVELLEMINQTPRVDIDARFSGSDVRIVA